MNFDEQLNASIQQERFSPPLRVQEAHIDDIETGVVRVHSSVLQRMGWQAGEVVLLEAPRQTFACVHPLRQVEDASNAARIPNPDMVQVDGLIRENAQVGIEDHIRLCSCALPPANTLLLTPVQRTSLGPDEIARLRFWLTARPFGLSDKVSVPLFFRKSTAFRINSFTPQGMGCVANASTDICIQESSRPITGEIPTVRYEDLGGLASELGRIREMIELPLKYPELFSHLRLEPPKGVLLYGPPGTGKTTIARAVASEVKAHFIRVNGPEIIHKFYGESEARLREIFEEAARRAPSIIFIDEIDAIAPKRTDVSGEVEKRVVGQLLALMDGLLSRGEVVVIGATNLPELIDHALRRPGRFDREIVIRAPDRLGRLEVLRIHSRGTPLAKDVHLEALAEITHGFVGADLEALCKEAGMNGLQRTLKRTDLTDRSSKALAKATSIAMEDFQKALKNITPTATREFFSERPNVAWERVGGLHHTKEQLWNAVQLPRNYPQLCQAAGLRNPQGIVLIGPPGCGKTLLVHALAAHSGLNFIAVDAASLFSKWVGESERALRQVFSKAKQAAPCILFFDGLDRMFPAQVGGAMQSGQERLSGQLLAEMDALASFSEVVVIGAAHHTQQIDAALLSPGRFGMVLHIQPLTQSERKEVLQRHTTNQPLAANVDLGVLAERSHGFNGGALEALCNRATMLCLQQHIQRWGAKANQQTSSFCVNMQALLTACDEMRTVFSHQGGNHQAE